MLGGPADLVFVMVVIRFGWNASTSSTSNGLCVHNGKMYSPGATVNTANGRLHCEQGGTWVAVPQRDGPIR